VGASDAQVALYLPESEPLLAPEPRQVEGEIAARIRELLATRGALFLHDILAHVGGFPTAVSEALWSMVWSGEVTNDTFAPVRGWLGALSVSRRRAPTRARHPAGAEGRWSLRVLQAPEPTSRTVALTRALLQRWGIVVREVASAEPIAGGFSAIYPVLRALEESGQARRGYFVQGRGGTQFAVPGAEEQLRALRDKPGSGEAQVLSAVDPANPYGAILPWPARPEPTQGPGARAQRVAGAHVVLCDGRLVGWLGKPGLVTYSDDSRAARKQSAALLARALGGLLARAGGRALLIPAIDGAPAAQSPHAAAFVAAGFVAGSRGLLLRRPARFG
jgi:ATP-dependent Lhr-like helicase